MMIFGICIMCVLYQLLILLTILAALLFIFVKITSVPFPKIIRYNEEKFYFNPDTKKDEEFPSLNDVPTVYLSVIVPAFDEEKRLPIMLDECIEYLEIKSKSDRDFTYEVIVVSDGSKDKTVELVHKYAEKWSTKKIRVLDLKENRGKGGAVRLGMLSARGRYVLFADADGATRFADLDKLFEDMNKLVPENETPSSFSAIVIGSRAHLEVDAIATRSFFRTILMHGFHFLVWLFAVREIRDTQCGFKLFTRRAAQILFPIMHVERWAFDVEILFLAQTYQMAIAEVAVQWQEIDGSKITPVWSWIQMGRDLFFIWFRYAIGAWKIKPKHSD